ncbi:glycosyltransferase [Demequina sp. NBRC 110053]|uniref:glycosyltransferase n=1 Tax=Demequina sp. NBRC 110053 TaxID=1570342 RepID=UPI000A02323D|nr:glycosyltransferase [Demequina sp. NBRC 110053]
MRIAHIANFYGPTSGGLRTAMHELGRGYAARGHEFLMVVPGAEDVDEDTPFGRRVQIASAVLPLSGGYRMITRTSLVRELLDGFEPDVIEVSDRTSLRGLGGWARARGIPSAFFAHERADGVIAAHLPSWTGRALPVRALADAHNRGTRRRFTSLIATTPFAAEEFDRIGAVTHTVPLGVDLDAFHPSRRDQSTRDAHAGAGEALLVMASRLSAEKCPDLAIDAVRELVRRGRRVRLVSAGTGALEARMRERARGLPVTFLGFIDGRESFARLLASADAVVAPGPIETFGLAALEALASGTPAVVNERSALPGVVGRGGVAAVSSPEGFADAIESVLDDDPAAASARARKRAETMPWSATVTSMLGIHERALARVSAATAPASAR